MRSLFGIVLGLAGLATAALAGPVTAIDGLGRAVSLEAPARRILLAVGRDLPALAMLDGEIVERLVGIGRDLQRQSPDVHEAYVARFPRLATLPVVEAGAGTFPTEQVVALAPDLVILGRTQAGPLDADGTTPLLRVLTAAGIPAAVIDFRQHPLRDTVPMMRLLGRLLGRDDRAAAFIAFMETHLTDLDTALGGRDDRPDVFLHAHAGLGACCFSPGQGTFADDIRAAGGRNAAAALLPGATGQVDAETLLGLDPAVYVGTGGTHLAGKGGLVLGTGVDPETARASLDTVLQAPALAQLSAVRRGRAYGLWHGFGDSPLNILAVEVLAKWLHPDRTAAIDPAATLAAINASFLAVPMTGTYWIARP